MDLFQSPEALEILRNVKSNDDVIKLNKVRKLVIEHLSNKVEFLSKKAIDKLNSLESMTPFVASIFFIEESEEVFWSQETTDDTFYRKRTLEGIINHRFGSKRENGMEMKDFIVKIKKESYKLLVSYLTKIYLGYGDLQWPFALENSKDVTANWFGYKKCMDIFAKNKRTSDYDPIVTPYDPMFTMAKKVKEKITMLEFRLAAFLDTKISKKWTELLEKITKNGNCENDITIFASILFIEEQHYSLDYYHPDMDHYRMFINPQLKITRNRLFLTNHTYDEIKSKMYQKLVDSILSDKLDVMDSSEDIFILGSILDLGEVTVTTECILCDNKPIIRFNECDHSFCIDCFISILEDICFCPSCHEQTPTIISVPRTASTGYVERRLINEHVKI